MRRTRRRTRRRRRRQRGGFFGALTEGFNKGLAAVGLKKKEEGDEKTHGNISIIMYDIGEYCTRHDCRG